MAGSRIGDKVKASKVVVECGGELYHLECARREHGDDNVIDELRAFYKREEKLSPPDASIRAGQLIKDIDRLKNKQFDFKGMRDRLDEKADNQSVEYDTFTTVFA